MRRKAECPNSKERPGRHDFQQPSIASTSQSSKRIRSISAPSGPRRGAASLRIHSEALQPRRRMLAFAANGGQHHRSWLPLDSKFSLVRCPLSVSPLQDPRTTACGCASTVGSTVATDSPPDPILGWPSTSKFRGLIQDFPKDGIGPPHSPTARECSKSINGDALTTRIEWLIFFGLQFTGRSLDRADIRSTERVDELDTS